jgi:hypothetical protein
VRQTKTQSAAEGTLDSDRWSALGGVPARGIFRRLRDKSAATGVRGAFTAALNKLLVQGASFDIVHVLFLDGGDVAAPPQEEAFELRFLTSEEVRRFARQADNELPASFAERVELGLDRCYAALSHGRLASYSWFALRCVEAEHAAGVPLGLPSDVAYLYKAFTHPRFRGQRLYAATTAGALRELERIGITHLLAFVYWNNQAALRACARMGYRDLGLLASRSPGLLRVPQAAKECGIHFGADAKPWLTMRLDTRGRRDGHPVEL